MPILDGYEASRKIRELENSNMKSSENASSKTLIIGLSGNQGEQHSRKCKMAGMNEAITKPIVFDQLNNIVKQALDPGSKTLNSSSNRKNTITATTNFNITTNSSSAR